MEWLSSLRGTAVGLDTAPLIYFIEKHPRYLPLVQPFFAAVEDGDVTAVTSTLTLTEVLVHPWRRGNQELVRQYSRILLHARNLQTIPVSPEIAAEAARIRATLNVKVPDAIQLATALSAGAASSLTNDAGIASLPSLKVFCLDRLGP
ncbi:MAG: PIN domain-containing protein [Acidobacteriaceae bacterium]